MFKGVTFRTTTKHAKTYDCSDRATGRSRVMQIRPNNNNLKRVTGLTNHLKLSSIHMERVNYLCLGEDVDIGSLLPVPVWFQVGAWKYMFKLSGWERRGPSRLPGFSRVMTANRHRLMKEHGEDSEYFHLLSATVVPEIADKAAFLTAVVQPLCVHWHVSFA